MTQTMDTKTVYDIKLDEIHVDENFNCRQTIAPIDVVDLARDIERQGLVQPVVVMIHSPKQFAETGFKYKLLAGFRRHFAHKVLKRPTIACVIRPEMSEADARILNLTENLQRSQLNVVQEAHAIKPLFLLGLTQQQVADRLGQSRMWVQIRYNLLTMPKEIQDVAAQGLLTQQQILKIYSLKSPDKQFAAVRKIKDALIRGEKIQPSEIKKASPIQKRIPDKAEQKEMLAHLMTSVGPGLATRVLAWILGNISQYDLYVDIKTECGLRGKQYIMPSISTEE